VGEDQVGLSAFELIERALHVDRDDDFVAGLLQLRLHQLGALRIGVDQQELVWT
jgi:hypothetical protein